MAHLYSFGLDFIAVPRLISTTVGGIDIVSPMSDPTTGFRRLPQMGNAQHRLFSLLTNLPPGQYFWSVQAVDTSFASGPFAAEGTVQIGQPTITLIARLDGGGVRLEFLGVPGSNYKLQVSTTLTNWTPLTNLVAGTNGAFEFTASATPLLPARFYRLRWP